MPVNTICLACPLSKYFKKYITTRGNHETAKRCGRKEWIENKYPENMNIAPPINEARDDALRYLKNKYTVNPANTK